MEKIIEQLHLVSRQNISMDMLYDECVTANNFIKHLTEHDDWVSKGTAEKWMEILQAADLPNILSVVSFVLSIPSSTGYVERVFSAMKNKWSAVQNKCSVGLIKSELIITLNYEMSCTELYRTNNYSLLQEMNKSTHGKNSCTVCLVWRFICFCEIFHVHTYSCCIA